MAYIFRTDNQLRVTSWGEELAELTGKKTPAVQGKRYYEVLPRILSGDKDALSVALEKNTTLSLKRYAFYCLVDHMNADVRINPIRTAGMVKGVKVTFSDLSPCSVAASLRNSRRFIDIGKTASSLAHGVRNPLNALKGAVVYLSERYANEPALAEFAQIMQEEISRLDNFISRFLSTSISNAGFTLVDINSLLEKMKAFTSLQAHASHITSTFEFGDIPPIMANAFQIDQAILNVVNNAMDAMRSGGQLVVTTRKETLSCEEFVMIEISDTGSGIARKGVDVPPLPVDEKGKGFGLFITREILQFHGGHFEIESKKDLGTSVRLYLPLKREGPAVRGS
ncbi:MAG TPA: ATP-binding protein [Thermodesulfovibrionales bacterium]|nr:ATP-binding protein [Thermodesulfovibrionales bacterium]